jgi:hypothetical protein
MLHLHCATNLSHHPTIAFLLVESRFQMLSAAMHVGDLVQTALVNRMAGCDFENEAEAGMCTNFGTVGHGRCWQMLLMHDICGHGRMKV